MDIGVEGIEFEIPARVLLGMACFAADDDPRSYLKAVYLEIRKDEIRLTAGDGKMMAFYREELEEPLTDSLFCTLIPASLIKRLKKRDALRLVEVCIFPETLDSEVPGKDRIPLLRKGDSIRLTCNMMTVEDTSFAGVTIPDYPASVPKSASGEVAQYQPCLLKKAYKAAKLLYGNKYYPPYRELRIAHNGEKAGLLSMPGIDNFFGFVMPFDTYAEKTATESPVWIFE